MDTWRDDPELFLIGHAIWEDLGTISEDTEELLKLCYRTRKALASLEQAWDMTH